MTLNPANTMSTSELRRDLNVVPVISLVLALLVANALPLVTAKYLGLGRPWINLDYLLLAALAFTPVRRLSLLLLPLVFLIDLLTLVSQLFPVSRIVDVIYLLKFALLSSFEYQFLLFLVLCSLLLVTFLFWKIQRSELGFKIALVILNVGILIYVVDVYAPQPEKNADRLWKRVHEPIASSQLVYYHRHSTTGFFESLSVDEKTFDDGVFPGVSERWFPSESKELHDRLLLIVNESWGLPLDPEIQDEIVQPLKQLGAKLEWFNLGEENFFGPTIAAEMRELCQRNPRYFNLARAAEELGSCLPSLLKERAYHLHVMHGAAGVMYDRVRWYPLVGFEEMIFFESRDWPSRCYSFPGACDIHMMSELEKAFQQPGKRFFYWLTLNSHSMYDARDIHVDVFDCRKHDLPLSSQACRNLKLHAQFFFELAKTLDNPHMSDVEVLIVGDHPPPIFTAPEEDEYFVEDMVGWLHLKTR